MKLAQLCLLALWLGHAAGDQVGGGLQKVLELMENCRSKGEKQLDEEQHTFMKYRTWKEGRQMELESELQEARDKVQDLIQEAEDGEAQLEVLTQDIAELNDFMGKAEVEKAEATEVRKAERAEFKELQEEQRRSADALQNAISRLQQPHPMDADKADALLQQITQAGASYQPALSAYLQMKEGSTQGQLRGNPALKLMKDLREKFRNERLEADSAEQTKENDYTRLIKNLDRRVERSKKEKENKEVSQGIISTEVAKARSDLAETQDAMKEAEKLLSDLLTTWKAKSSIFEMNEQVRKEEQEVLTQAIEVVRQSSKALLQETSQVKTVPVVVSFLQDSQSQTQRDASDIQGKEESTGSAGAASAGPLTKVIKMVYALKTQKQEELLDMADKKAWCDKENATNWVKLEESSTAVETLSGQQEKNEAKLEDMQEEVKTLGEEQSKLLKHINSSTQQRADEEADNKAALEEAREGAAAAEQAMEILGRFYNSMPSLLQGAEEQSQAHSEAPDAEEYKGREGKGIVDVLEVVVSDYHKEEAEAKAAEEESVREFDKLMMDLKESAAKKKARQEHLRRKVDELESELATIQDELASSSEQLKEATSYDEELRNNCIGKTESREERIARRKEEIAALKQANEELKEQSGLTPVEEANLELQR